MTDLTKILDDETRHRRATLAFLALSGSDLTGDNRVFRSAADMVDDLSFLLGLVIESDPHATAPSHLRLRGEDIGRRVAAYAKAIRDHDEATGESIISAFGVEKTVKNPPK
jgi:hypothetical protein